MKRDRIAPPTLEQMRREAPWTWVNCTNTKCHHRMPLAITPLIIRGGPDASSDQLRASARCAKCGRKGATLTSWGGMDMGVLPFPKDCEAQGLSRRNIGSDADTEQRAHRAESSMQATA